MAASDITIMKALSEILDREKAVQSQSRLEAMLQERFNVKTGGRRLRRLAQKTGVRMTIEWKHGKDMTLCPFCGKEMKEVFSVDLLGKETLVARRCACSFKSYRGKVPMRYIFARGRKNAVRQ